MMVKCKCGEELALDYESQDGTIDDKSFTIDASCMKCGKTYKVHYSLEDVIEN